MIYEEAKTSDFFEAWFQKFLEPTLITPLVIIMDNARFHRMGKLEILWEEYEDKLLPLPLYSHEYKTWAHIKKNSKRYYQVAILLTMLCCLVLVSIDYNS